MNKALLFKRDPWGCRKHSFSHVVVLGIFLNRDNFAILLYLYMYTDTQLYLCLFLRNKKKTFPSLSALAHSFGADTGRKQKGLRISAPRSTSIFWRFLSFLPATLFLGKWRPLFFPSANTDRVFQAWRSSCWTVYSQPTLHRAGLVKWNAKYMALLDKC